MVLLTAPLLATTALSGCAGTPPTVESYPEWSARRMKLNEIEVHYFDFFAQEPATPVVWIHGYSGCAFETYFVKDHLAPRRRLIAPDLPGNGYSDKPDIDYTLEYYVGFLHDFIGELGLDEYILVGHSMGGLIASAFAAEHPIGLERLVLVAPFGLEGEAGPVLDFLARTGFLVDAGLQLHNETILGIAIRANVFHEPDRIPDDLVNYLAVGTFHTENGVEAIANVTQNIIGVTHDPSILEEVLVPTLIVWGSQDRILEYRFATEFDRLIPNSYLQTVPDCGHMPHVELPEVTGAIMSIFLK